jgi:choline dehydrogenase-like flavoprotein
VSVNHYDVIIIGSGAGGGTLLHRLAPSGKRILILERGEYVPREKANWDPRAVIRPRRSGRTATAIRCTRTQTTTSAATPSFTEPPCSGCGAKISAR